MKNIFKITAIITIFFQLPQAQVFGTETTKVSISSKLKLCQDTQNTFDGKACDRAIGLKPNISKEQIEACLGSESDQNLCFEALAHNDQIDSSNLKLCQDTRTFFGEDACYKALSLKPNISKQIEVCLGSKSGFSREDCFESLARNPHIDSDKLQLCRYIDDSYGATFRGERACYKALSLKPSISKEQIEVCSGSKSGYGSAEDCFEALTRNLN